MELMVLKVFLCIVIPIFLLSGILEKRSRQIIISVCGGCIACLSASFVNSWLYSKTDCSELYLTTSIAPFVEETFKFIPILLFAKRISKEKMQLLSVSFATGIGFAIIENSFMLAESLDTATISWLIVRGVGTGLMHGMSTTIVGSGIYLAAKDKRLFLTGTMGTLFLAMMYHGAYNALIITEGIKYFGIFIPLLSYGTVIAMLNKEKIRELLQEDTEQDDIKREDKKRDVSKGGNRYE